MDTSRLDPTLAKTAVNTIRMLSADMVEKARSGHPGMPMGFADIAFVLWTEFLRFNPKDPAWPNRDRFILSAGHGCALLYSLLHLSGYDLSLDDLKQFRQWGSSTPGHPEYGHTPGVETTTGPLGQGFGNGVGMGLAQKIMAARFNKKTVPLIDHFIYAAVGDGDLMEGVTSESASLAGHLGLGNLIYIYDSNQITIEGKTDLAFTEEVARRFEGYQWQVLKIDGHDHNAIRQAIREGQQEKERPTLIIARTHIGMGSPHKQDTSHAHGEPLGEKELALTKQALDWPLDKPFYIPGEVKALFDQRVAELKPLYEEWQKEFIHQVHSDKGMMALWNSHFNKAVPADLEEKLMATVKGTPTATRSASGEMIQMIAREVPAFLGGSADLAPSTKTHINESGSIAKGEFSGKNLHFGVREHGMGSLLNGMALYGGIIPFGATFLIFSDYMRPPIRLAALMKQQVIYLFTHDSIFVGEDGPTHEPVEQLPSLRLIPNLLVIRPADATETAAAWTAAMNHKDGPTALILTRQNLPVLDRNKFGPASNLTYGAYILADCEGQPEMILMASGSEVSLALEVATELRKKEVKVRVVSFPSRELFEAQSAEYQEKVLPRSCRKMVVIEAAASAGWHRYAGRDGLIIGVDRFGASAPASELAREYGFTVEKVLEKISGKWGL